MVLGAGAAGLMCAIEAGKRGRRVLLIERNQQAGRKILISGGGRCNFTNLYATPEHYISGNPHFARSAMARYTPADFIALVENHGIAYHEKKLGQLFCDGSARRVVDMLLAECSEAGVDILTDCRVEGVERAAGRFGVQSSRGDFEADSLVVVTGGSIPKMGATDFGLQLARRFGLPVTEVRPGLVPLRFEGEVLAFCASLAGVSIDVEVSCAGQAFRENLLFTHRGISGPAVLQISSYWREGDEIAVDLLPGEDAAAVVAEAAERGWGIQRLLEARHPRRFAHAWTQRFGAPGPISAMSERSITELAERLHAWRLTPACTEGYEKAEVTVGGVDTRALSSRTMECRDVPGLYFIGECVDVTGWLGGYNFQWAWASGYAAGQAV
jgi:predicted Rossmann fold flavoprotein